MTQTTTEARQQILDELATAVEQSAVAVACLGRAYELLAVGAAGRLEGELFRPAKRAYARGKRTHSGFAGRTSLEGREFGLPEPGTATTPTRELVERAVAAAVNADSTIAALQDSLLPVESGDPELRAGLGEMRDALARIPLSARELIRGLGR